MWSLAVLKIIVEVIVKLILKLLLMRLKYSPFLISNGEEQVCLCYHRINQQAHLQAILLQTIPYRSVWHCMVQ